MPAQESSSVVQIGKWLVHPALDSISRGTETQKLEPRAMALLMCLANAEGDVVSVDQLLNEVWAGVVVGPASVYQAVSQLRKLLGDVDPNPSYIANVPRKGYRLIATVQRTGAAQCPEKSIAVLPFADMSEKKDQEYFADGMAEEIIGLLVKIPGLKVIGRTSSFQFKDKSEDLRNIGTQLGVAYILEGSVRKSGDRLRVVAQLIDSRDGTHLWSQTYDRELSDVLRMQDEIAATLVRALQIQVSPVDIISRAALRSPEAYTSYLQGLHAYDRFDQQGLQQAVSDYQRALELDPSFAAAAAQLASAYFVLGQAGYLPPTVAFEKAREASQRALMLDPSLARAHLLLSEVYRAYDWDWAAAHREVRAAVNLAPNDAFVLLISAVQTLGAGNWDDGIKLVNASLAQDPLNATAYMFLGRLQLCRRRFKEAEVAIRRSLEISPTFGFGHYTLGSVLLVGSRPEAALAEYLKETTASARLGGSSMAYFALGRKVESDAALAQLIKRYGPYAPFGIAVACAFRGESDEVFKWLERAYAQRDASLSFIKGAPLFKNLKDDPRYKAFLKKMNLPE
jgi:TolB-like protein